MTILYKTDACGKVLSIMVTKDTNTSKIESLSPYHEIRRADAVLFDDQWNYWILCIPFDGQFHDVTRYPIYNESMRKFCFQNCYNVINYTGRVILC